MLPSHSLLGFKLAKSKTYKFKNGPLDVALYLYDVNEKQVSQSQEKTGLNFEGSTAFGNRIKKNKIILTQPTESLMIAE
mgnify:CR=1 FL=1